MRHSQSSPERLVYPAVNGTGTALVVAHGAGAGQRSPFMIAFSHALSALGIDVVTFDFPYMAAGRRIPDKAESLEAHYRKVIDEVRDDPATAGRLVFIGGKSMGGRIATQVAVDPDLPIAGVVLLGYPLHPPGRPAVLRTAHLPRVRRPMLFVQGSRDTFGTPEELKPILSGLTPAPSLYVVEGGDHSLKLGGRDRAAQERSDRAVHAAIVEWVTTVSREGGG